MENRELRCRHSQHDVCTVSSDQRGTNQRQERGRGKLFFTKKKGVAQQAKGSPTCSERPAIMLWYAKGVSCVADTLHIMHAAALCMHSGVQQSTGNKPEALKIEERFTVLCIFCRGGGASFSSPEQRGGAPGKGLAHVLREAGHNALVRERRKLRRRHVQHLREQRLDENTLRGEGHG